MNTSISEQTDTTTKTSHYPMFKVLIHNDPVTTFIFVWYEICMGIFHMDAIKAMELTKEIHNTGLGLAGTYTLEVAELKCEQVHSMARGRNYPLRCTIEPA